MDWADARHPHHPCVAVGRGARLARAARPADPCRTLFHQRHRVAGPRNLCGGGAARAVAGRADQRPRPAGGGRPRHGQRRGRAGAAARTASAHHRLSRPATARVLAVAPRSGGVMRFLHVLHGSLQVPGIGRTIVGWIGVAMLLSSMTGLWLWWPSVGRWTKGFRWRRHRNTDSNLHYQMGFWIALPLFVLSLTGVWISFPGVFGGREGGGRPAFAPPVAEPAQSVDTVVARAAGVAKGPLRSVGWPTERSADWTVSLANGRRIRWRTTAESRWLRRRASGWRGALDAADSRWRRHGDRLAGGDFPRRAVTPSPRTWSGVHSAARGKARGSIGTLAPRWNPEPVRGDGVGGAGVVEYARFGCARRRTERRLKSSPARGRGTVRRQPNGGGGGKRGTPL
jgi:hypothetical protein